MLPFQVASATTPDPAALYASMTLEQRVGQVFMVSAFGPGVTDTTAAFLAEVTPGAVAMFTSNGGTPADMTATVNAWQRAAGHSGAHIPLLVATDQEGGTVTRLVNGFSTLPAGWAIGAMPPSDARAVGKIVGQELSAVGITMNLAPVTDVQTIRSNVLMDRRTFGSDADRVGAAAAALDAGLRDAGVIGVLKHFPGHGDAGDSHTLLPVVADARDRVEAVELESFRVAIKAGAEAVMVGHLVYPALDPTPDLPASLSVRIIGGVLRGELGFDGLVMTDALDMGAIADHVGRGAAAVQALNAGADMLVTGPNMPLDGQRGMVHAVLDAVRSGAVPEARLADAVTRILTLKARHGLLIWTALDVGQAAQRVDVAGHQAALDAAFADTITLARDAAHVLPLHAGAQRVGIVYPGIFPSTERACASHDPGVVGLAYSRAPTDAEIGAVKPFSRAADVILAFTYDAFYQPRQQNLINALPPEKTIVIALQNPYDYTAFPGVSGYVLTYMALPSTFSAACDVLYGTHPARGTLPVTLAADLPAGSGLH